jgi:hypothetical protein
MRFNIIIPGIFRSHGWSLRFWFSDWNVVCGSHPSRACYIYQSSHSPWYDHPNKLGEESTSRVSWFHTRTAHFFQLICHFVLLWTLESSGLQTEYFRKAWCLRSTCCLHLQDRRMGQARTNMKQDAEFAWLTFRSWRLRRHIPPKHWVLAELNGAANKRTYAS